MNKLYSFKNDYAEMAHPNILEALLQYNSEQDLPYGNDEFSLKTEKTIQDLCKNPNIKVHFVSGGTQANLIVISAFLRPHESVISTDTAHIFTNEAGAIEATGHKVHGVPNYGGKLRLEEVQKVIDSHQNKPHQLKQKMLYISNSTELGSIYTKQELRELSEFCKKNQMYLYLDGARLGHALVAKGNDVTLKDIAELCDAFYIGGTKNGALFGEAIVICNPELQEDFGFHIKQKGAMLAKTRVISLQFDTLLKDNLYFDLAKQANFLTQKIKQAFEENACKFLVDSPTNQIFPILGNTKIELLQKEFDFYVWKKIDEKHSAVRLICSCLSLESQVEKFVALVHKIFKEG